MSSGFFSGGCALQLDDGSFPGIPSLRLGIVASVKNDPMKQLDEKVRELNSQLSTTDLREEVYCTRKGEVHPEEMYIVAAHMDGQGGGEAANDDGSGTALVMELARVFSSPRNGRFGSRSGITKRRG